MSNRLFVALVGSVLAAMPALAASNSNHASAMSSAQFWSSTLWFVIIAVFGFYVFVTLPTLKREEARKKFLEQLKKGDEVITSGGIIGKVVAVSAEAITIEIAPQVRVRAARDHVHAFNRPAPEPGKTKENNKS